MIEVSVIVTTYNRKELLRETLDSILSQTYKDFELIVVDNYSDYDFMEFISLYNDSRIRAFKNRNEGIIAVNRNFGLRKANGKFIAFCDDDDLWFPEKLEKQLPFFENENVVGVGSNVQYFGANVTLKHNAVKKDTTLKFKQLFYASAPLSSLVIRRANILFDESSLIRNVEDADFQLQLTHNNDKEIVVLKEPLVNYRVHALNESRSKIIKHNFFNVLAKYKSDLSEKEYNNKFAQLNFSRAFLLLNAKRTSEMQDYLKNAFNYGTAKMKFMVIVLHAFSVLPKSALNLILSAYYYLKKVKFSAIIK